MVDIYGGARHLARMFSCLAPLAVIAARPCGPGDSIRLSWSAESGEVSLSAPLIDERMVNIGTSSGLLCLTPRARQRQLHFDIGSDEKCRRGGDPDGFVWTDLRTHARAQVRGQQQPEETPEALESQALASHQRAGAA